MYLLQYWYSESSEDGWEDLAVAETKELLQKSSYIEEELNRIREVYTLAKVELGEWTDAHYDDYISDSIRAPINLSLENEKDNKGKIHTFNKTWGLMVIIPIPLVIDEEKALNRMYENNKEKLEEFVHKQRIAETEKYLERQFGLERDIHAEEEAQ
jgi:hypothetical protein